MNRFESIARLRRLFRGAVQGLLLSASVATLSATAQADDLSVGLVGLNMSGAGFAAHVLPGLNNRNYIFPTETHFKDWSERGVRLIRFPIIWERLQPKLYNMLDPDYVGLIQQTMNYAQKYNVRVILDLHNYARYRGELIGTKNVPYAAYHDVMYRIAFRWAKHPALYAYDIMNEPNGALDYWPTAAQHGINGVRTVDKVKPIIVEGNGWAEATRWAQWNDSLLNLKDPSDNLIFSAHTYFDNNSGGTYETVDVSTLDPMYGVARVKPFVEWLKKHGKKGYIGEFGVPDNDPRWLVLMDNMLAYLRQNCIPATYWAAGPGWGDYNLAVEPVNGQERPQWPTLKKYLSTPSQCIQIGPN